MYFTHLCTVLIVRCVFVNSYIFHVIENRTTVETSSMYSQPPTAMLGSEGNFSVSLTFRCIAILIGIVGVVTNGVLLAALISSYRVKKTVNVFIINQVALDLFSSAILSVTYVMKISTPHFVGTFGSFLCIVFDSDMITFVGLTGSIVNLVLIAAERYFLIVYPILHKAHVKRGLILALGTLPWVGGVANTMPNFWTSAVVDGICFKLYFFPSKASQLTYSICIILLTFFIPLALLVFFYASILLVVRQRSQVFQGHYANQDMSMVLQTNAHCAQMNIISTMIIVSVAFVVCWLPSQIWFLFLVI